MLEIKNLTKIYKSKSGEVKALDGVTLTFPETGMVFLLGKSGSGKSTLLNVCGGLDAPTSGEIIVRGRSSNTFTGSDFDSYRNTFIGFIFQEYNILNEFTVEENLAIALELQGKKKNAQRIAELLKQVDLEGFAKRKPNTLSGGQKQRIAIARALIKDPRIIMADEPTGALDSATGKQVFDTLKKLSADRLVLVVSHDREFAEIYGDRIIELKDGKVISDVTKEKVPSGSLSDNVTIIGEDILSVKRGASLSDDDVRKINSFLFASDSGVIITRGEKNVRSFKQTNRIGDDNSTEAFAETDVLKIRSRAYTEQEGKFVKSRLPMSKAVKMGASSLKVKPVRLFFTILLSVVAFIMFGVFSTLMTYNEADVIRESFAKSNYNVINVNKNFFLTNRYFENGEERSKYETSQRTVFTPADVENVESVVGKVVPYVSFASGGGRVSVYNVSTNAMTSRLLADYSFDGFAEKIDDADFAPIIYGSYPANTDEVAISVFFAQAVMQGDCYKMDADGNIVKEIVDINTVAEIIDKRLGVRINGNDVVLKVVGVFDGGEVPEKFDGYDAVDISSTWDYVKLYEFSSYLSGTMQKLAFVSDGFITETIEKTDYRFRNGQNDYDKYFTSGKYYYYSGENVNFYISAYRVYDKSVKDMLPVYFFDGVDRNKLTGDEIVVPFDSFMSMQFGNLPEAQLDAWKAEHSHYNVVSQDYYQRAGEYAGSYDSLSERERAEYDYYNSVGYLYECMAVRPHETVITLSGILDSAKWYKYYPSIEKTVIDDAVDVVCRLFNDYYPELTINLIADMGGGTVVSVKGFYFDPSDGYSNYNCGVYVSEEKYSVFEYSNQNDYYSTTETKYSLPDAEYYYEGVFIPYGATQRDKIDKVLLINNVRREDDSFFVINNTLYSSIISISSIVGTMSKVFLYIGLAMAAFAALLLFNFISVSINHKMHEIGVLRAVGARGADVFKIFFSESFIISLICIVISAIATVAIVLYINSELSAALRFSLQLLVFGPVPLAMMIAVALAVALIGTFIPVFRISRKKPVDSMKG